MKKKELPNIKFRRSLYFLKDLKEGSIINKNDVASVRPGYGIPPKNINSIIGKKVNKNIKKFSAVKFEDIS